MPAAERRPRTTTIWKLAAIGTLAGVFSGLFGVGGGTVIVPLLIFWFGYGERLATGTSLAAIVLIGLLGALAQGGIYGNVHVGTGAAAGDPGGRSASSSGPRSSSGSRSAPSPTSSPRLLVAIAIELILP